MIRFIVKKMAGSQKTSVTHMDIYIDNSQGDIDTSI